MADVEMRGPTSERTEKIRPTRARERRSDFEQRVLFLPTVLTVPQQKTRRPASLDP